MMWGYGYDAGSWVWMVGMMVVFWGVVIALVIWGIRTLTGPRATGDSALEALRKRLAAGEISLDDYERIKKALG